ncbi:hypothetical protein ACFFLM_10565 [Deinococcus oregonensis]|uniref:Uncharacterized protein n=1 Tax=Deinococcus oregonensis TaxID=1805970 RepID=A0ABV6AZH0_9DEIO
MNPETQQIGSELVGKRVWFNGQRQLPCEIVPGYHASVFVDSARVLSVWQLDASGVNVSPQGGLVDGGSIQNEQMGTSTTLVMLGEPQHIRFAGASLDSSLEAQSARLIAQAPQRCTTLPAIYASSEDVRRNLVTSAPQKLTGMPQSAHQLEQWLVGKTKKQLLATYGSPNEQGSLAAIMALPTWHYGDVPYASMVFTFDTAGRVSKALIATSP